MRTLIILFALMTFNSLQIFSQKEVQINQVYDNVSVKLSSGVTISAQKFIYVNDSTISFTNKQTNTNYSMISSEINYIKVVSGSYAGDYALYGGLLGLTSTLYAWSDVGYNVPFNNVFPVLAGFTVGFGAIGALIGLCSPKYTRLYLPSNSNTYHYYIHPKITNDYCGISLVCQIK